MKRHKDKQYLIPAVVLWILAASGCSLLISPDAYGTAGSSDASGPSVADASEAGLVDACLGCDAGLQDATPPALERLSLPLCLDMEANTVPPVIFQDSGPQGDRLHLIGLYQANKSSMDVTFTVSGPNVLVLSSYKAVSWQLNLGLSASLNKVYVISVEAPSSLTVLPDNLDPDKEILQWTGAGACGYQPRMSPASGDCDTEMHIARVQLLTQLMLANYGGCYGGEVAIISNASALAE